MNMAPFNPSGGGNPSGFNILPISTPTPGVMGTPATQGNNPVTGPVPSGNNMVPSITSPFGFPANTSATGTGPGSAANPLRVGQNQDQLARGLRDAGIPSALAQSLAFFIKNGAGYNKDALNAIFAAMGPQIGRGEANIMEQFGSMGLGMSSPAAIGMGDFLSQVNLNMGEIAAQMYEQSVQNYLQIMLGQKSQDGPGFWQGLGESLLGQGTSGLLQKAIGAIHI